MENKCSWREMDTSLEYVYGGMNHRSRKSTSRLSQSGMICRPACIRYILPVGKLSCSLLLSVCYRYRWILEIYHEIVATISVNVMENYINSSMSMPVQVYLETIWYESVVKENSYWCSHDMRRIFNSGIISTCKLSYIQEWIMFLPASRARWLWCSMTCRNF